MISRRHFVQAGAVSAAVLGVKPFVGGAIAESTLPPSIAALKSMKDRPNPLQLMNDTSGRQKRVV